MPHAPCRTGVTLNYEISGEGDPLLLIMGTSGAIPLWGEVTARLAERYRVIAYDNRGLGGSERGDGEITVPSLAEDASALLEALDVPPAVRRDLGNPSGPLSRHRIVMGERCGRDTRKGAGAGSGAGRRRRREGAEAS